jgi:hypothetical protein
MRWNQADKRDWQDLLRGIRNAIASAGQTTVEAIGENTKATEHAAEQQPPQPLSRITVDVQIPREETDHYYTEQRSSQRLQWWTFLATVGTFVAVAAYAVITYLQWHTMDATFNQIQKQTAATITAANAATEQTKLLRQQLIGTQAALLRVDFDINATGIRIVVQLHSSNNGTRVTATKVQFVGTAIRKHIPDMRQIGGVDRLDWKGPDVPGSGMPGGGAQRQFVLTGYTQNSLNDTYHFRQRVTIQGRFSYDNGFGDIMTEDICTSWLRDAPIDPGAPERPGGPPGWVPCDQVKIWLDKVREVKAAESQKVEGAH